MEAEGYVSDPGREADMPKTKSKRVSKACLHCRQRKSKCDLDSSGSPGVPPCQRCIREHRECVLGTSNRGGRRIRKDKIKSIISRNNNNGSSSNIIATPKTSDLDVSSPSTTEKRPGGSSASYRTPVGFMAHNPSTTTASVSVDDEDSTPIESVPRNPSDAWQCLTGIAKGGPDGAQPTEGLSEHLQPGALDGTPYNGLPNGTVTEFKSNHGIRAYRLVQNGSLDPGTVWQLVHRYAENFHPYLPLVPRKYFDRNALDTFASNEKHLLTAVLTIASKDLERQDIHEYCSKYMHELISGIAAGADCDVEAVEALLLLAEWEPQGLRSRVESVGRGEEDRAAWMHVGLALRSGYFLGLDRTSFRGDGSGDLELEARKRLAWTSCYISDRLISVRIGRAFWSRGPGPMTGLVSQDFPSLQPVKEGDEDYARIFQALLDLTQLYGNVHDILYSGMRTSNQMMLMGDYVKYVDDFRLAILRWKSKWGSLDCSPPIQVTLKMSYEYLRLYTNAFAFQATISQSLVSKPHANSQSQREHLKTMFSNLASMQDARFIFESIDAAKAYLSILVDTVDPEKHLHFMPLRFYLYGIYAAVFLYKARSFGVLHSEEFQLRDLITRMTEVLHRASTGPDDIGARYARLLELLWKVKAVNTASPASTHKSNPGGNRAKNNSISSNGDLGMHHHHHQQQQQASSSSASSLGRTTGEYPYLNFSPANDFSWLDLEAVGDFVSGDQMPGAGMLGFETYMNMNPDPYGSGSGSNPDRGQLWQMSWVGDTNSLLF